MDDGKLQQTDGIEGRHGAARQTAEAAVEARAAGDHERADMLMEQAGKTDPGAVADVLAEHPDTPSPTPDTEPQDDAEVAAMSRTVEPGSAAPSRSGITGSGSGADGQR